MNPRMHAAAVVMRERLRIDSEWLKWTANFRVEKINIPTAFIAQQSYVLFATTWRLAAVISNLSDTVARSIENGQ